MWRQFRFLLVVLAAAIGLTFLSAAQAIGFVQANYATPQTIRAR